MKKILFIFPVLFLAFYVNASAAEISIDSAEVRINETFKINVNIESSETIGASFDITFDGGIIEALEVEEGDFMKQCTKTTFYSIKPVIGDGKIKFRDMCFSEMMKGKGVIAKVSFRAKSPGKSRLSLEDVNIFNGTGDSISGVKVISGEVRIKENEINPVKVSENAVVLSNENAIAEINEKNIFDNSSEKNENPAEPNRENNISVRKEDSKDNKTETNADEPINPGERINEPTKNQSNTGGSSLAYAGIILILILISFILSKKR